MKPEYTTVRCEVCRGVGMKLWGLTKCPGCEGRGYTSHRIPQTPAERIQNAIEKTKKP